MSEQKFKVGDRVKCKSNCGICCDDVFIREGQILKIESDETCFRTYDVSFTSNVTARVHYDDLELIEQDPKTAFLTELKALLEKYDAEFGDYEEYEVHFKIGDEYIYWDTMKGDVTPENIFDYDK